MNGICALLAAVMLAGLAMAAAFALDQGGPVLAPLDRRLRVGAPQPAKAKAALRPAG